MTCLLCPKFDQKFRGGGGTSRKIGGVCGTPPETLTLFQTKIIVFFLPYFIPDQKFDTLFQT